MIEIREYRIGEFAKYLGVTPDLLKHYEDQGIIRPSRSDSGYRYYPFNTTMLLIECIRLRNYGMTLREIRDILTAHRQDNASVNRRLSENVEHMKEEILLDEALAADYEIFLNWAEPLKSQDSDWEIRWSRPMAFLPHTDRYDFLQDPRIYEILKSWMSYIPIVKSSMKAKRDGRITWGLLVEERLMNAGLVLASCGIAYALRYIRANTQGGVLLGFTPADAQRIVAQTMKGAASLLSVDHSHPEAEIDKVTTPAGLTIRGLNAMERNGFTTAIIEGLMASIPQSK